ncbi:Hypothetical protein NAEGRDRAFT_48789 [Naegleria gruberi]|uniref:F-box domain-containing protein n=1 Tax=Naegleria gruberi TaxID=5762 RepID=D2VE14_NAEGR|nr:uncharacterized protein NAEGRDRAFT_48789 [Naegleria gruberi]EFC44998.1 Hypothetical protein NAEGRDRAFT_48789 [Naegleria gruberi]|eukprot:XP_002677742.1 Hypothetical protein NAEGRDRAFT_48789 [Naegleria gruberi strain NEG-M]
MAQHSLCNNDECNKRIRSTIEQLPTECWLNIFKYLELQEIKRISLLMSPVITWQLLDTTDQSFFRLLCEANLKSDLEKVIQSIIERPQVPQLAYKVLKGASALPRSQFVYSISQLREKLRICVLKSKVLFPNWFKEESLNESIDEAVQYSYSINRPVVFDDDENDEIVGNYVEKQRRKASI